MCGIAWYSLSGLTEDQVAALETDFARRVSHRGPDGLRLVRRNCALWAFHRLAVVNGSDPSQSGMQPFVSAAGGAIICNGEIYNFRDLLPLGDQYRSDCEAVLCAMDRAPPGEEPGAVGQIDGDFAFVYESPDGRLVMARDHVGVAPLFVGIGLDGRTVRAAASEAKALVGAPGVARVRVFPPGHVWTSDDHAAFRPYTPVTAAAAAAAAQGGQQAPESAVRSLLTEAVRKRLNHSDRPVGVLCSGGLDSALVAWIVSQEPEAARKVRVFTMEYDADRSQDAFYARLLCQQLGLQHTVFSFTREEALQVYPEVARVCETHDANTLRAAVPMYLLAHRIARDTDVRVILSGEGADELFQGYAYFCLAPDPASAAEEARRLVRNIHAFDLLRAERCFASAGIEVRVPYLDQSLVAYVQGLDPALMAGGDKSLLRGAFATCSRELQETRIIRRPKEKFSDGCGFNYVPRLLNDLCSSRGSSTAVLADRLAGERACAAAAFDSAYPGHRDLIIARTMPPWATRRSGAGEDDLLIS